MNSPDLFEIRAIGPLSIEPVRVPRFAVRIILTTIVVTGVQFFIGGPVNLSNIIMITNGLCVFLFILYYNRRKNRFWPKLMLADFSLLTYVIWCGLSALWSVDINNTIIQTILIFMFWFCCYLIRNASVIDCVKDLLMICSIVALLSISIIFIAPDLAYQPHSSTGFPELRGILGHQLHLGALMAVAMCFITIASLNNQIKSVSPKNVIVFILMVTLIFSVMVLSLARSYILYAIISLPIAIALGRGKFLRWISIATLIALAISIVTNVDIILGVIGDESGDATLSGRTRIWKVSYDTYLAGEKILGFGYASFAEPYFDYLWGLYRPPHPHNSAISALFETGLVGLIAIGFYVIIVIAQLIMYSAKNRKVSYGLFLTILSFLAGLTGVVYAGKPTILLGLTFLFSGLELNVKKQRKVGNNLDFNKNNIS